MLAGLTRQVDFWGNIASVGLAGGAELKTTVMPFILRGVNLLGINSSATPRAERLEVWRRIATDLAPRHLERIAQPHDPVRRVAGRVPGIHRRQSYRPHSRKDRLAAVNFAAYEPTPRQPSFPRAPSSVRPSRPKNPCRSSAPSTPTSRAWPRPPDSARSIYPAAVSPRTRWACRISASAPWTTCSSTSGASPRPARCPCWSMRTPAGAARSTSRAR